jgi:hypothetical protein
MTLGKFAAIAVIVALTVTSNAALAQEKRPSDRMAYGAGMVTCAEWQQYRTTGNKPAALQLQAWVDGFLTGFNMAISDADLLAPKPESVAYYTWIDNYCSQKPLRVIRGINRGRALVY